MIKFRNPAPAPLVHCCLLDRQCRALGVPPYLYLHFLQRKNGDSVRFLVWFDRTT